MKANLKTIVLALVAGFILAAASAETACAAKAGAGSPDPCAEVVTAGRETAETKAKPRRTRRAKKANASTSAGESKKRPVRRRRSRKAQPVEIPVTGMLDSAE